MGLKVDLMAIATINLWETAIGAHEAKEEADFRVSKHQANEDLLGSIMMVA